MSDFVLVHGAWHGAWCWKRILPALWQAGHRAFTVSLSGVGERAHLGPAGITLDTHTRRRPWPPSPPAASGCAASRDGRSTRLPQATTP